MSGVTSKAEGQLKPHNNAASCIDMQAFTGAQDHNSMSMYKHYTPKTSVEVSGIRIRLRTSKYAVRLATV